MARLKLILVCVLAVLLQMAVPASSQACDAACQHGKKQGQSNCQHLPFKTLAEFQAQGSVGEKWWGNGCTRGCRPFDGNNDIGPCNQACEVVRWQCQPKAAKAPRRQQAQQADNEKISCGRLWFERNRLFHQNGYCFKSSRGKKAFGNAGCRHRSSRAAVAAMSEEDRADLKSIQAEERRSKCN